MAKKPYLDFAELRSRVTIEDYVSRRGILLKKSGKELKGSCPFHDDRHPSFGVSPGKGLWFCPVCVMGGDVIKLAEKYDGHPDYYSAGVALDAEFCGGELAASAPEGKLSQSRDAELKTEKAVFDAGIEILDSIANGREYRGDTEAAEAMREYIQNAVFDERCPEQGEAEIRAYITLYGSDGDFAELDSIKPFSSLKPTDFSDVAEGKLFAAEYGNRVLHTSAFGWMVYDGKRWIPSDDMARGLVQEFTERQLDEAGRLYKAAGAEKVEAAKSGGQAERDGAEAKEKKAEAYLKFAGGRRDTRKVAATMTEARPSLAVDTDELDSHPFLVNTPAGTYNVETGKMKPHDFRDLLTMQTKYQPSEAGREIWEDFVLQVSDGDEDLAKFLKRVAGMCLCGKVFDELLIIVAGTGGNGKSTFFNSIADAIGDYAGSITPDIFMADENHRFDMAGLRGKRMVIAAETTDGQKLDSSMVKRLCSTDTIRAELKHKDAFDFVPCHHTIMFTNHLPAVETGDSGTWARLMVIPFTHDFRGRKGETKNYSDFLLQNCGEAIVKWCLEGAEEFLGYKNLSLNVPDCVAEVTEKYRATYDVLHGWIMAKCETGRRCSEQSSDLLESYNDFAREQGDDTISSKTFAKLIRAKGYRIERTRTGSIVAGLKIKK